MNYEDELSYSEHALKSLEVPLKLLSAGQQGLKQNELLIIGGGSNVGYSKLNFLKSRSLLERPDCVWSELEWKPGDWFQSETRLKRHIKPKIKRHLRKPQQQVMRVGRWYTSKEYSDIAFGNEFFAVPRYAKFKTARQAKAYFNKHPVIVKVMKSR